MLSTGRTPPELELKLAYKKTVHLTRHMTDLLEVERLWKDLKRKCELLFPHFSNIEAATHYFNLINGRLSDVQKEMQLAENT